MTKTPSQIYLDLFGRPLEGFNSWNARKTFLREAELAEATGLGNPYTEEERQRLKDEFQPLSLLDCLAPYNRGIAEIHRELQEQLKLSRLDAMRVRYTANSQEMFVALYPTVSVNALTYRTSARKFLVLLNFGLTHTLYILTKLGTSRMWLSSEELATGWEPEIPLEQLQDYMKRYFDAYISSNGRELIADHLVTPRESQIPVLAQIVHYAEKFAVAHEMGHIISGHLKQGKLSAFSLADEPVEVYQTTFEDEFEADQVGFEVIFADFPAEEQPDDFELRMAIAGVNMVFRTLEVLEKLQGVTNRTHPPATSRRNELIHFVRRYQHANLSISNMLDFRIENELLKNLVPEWRDRPART